MAAPAVVHEVLAAPGRPLDSGSRSFFEPRLGVDLGGVRVHDDPLAARSAEAVDALAYTVGEDVAFAAGRYAPQSVEGRVLLAHELAHVAQQTPVLRRQQPPAPAPTVTPTGRLQTPEISDPDRILQVDCVKRRGGCWLPMPAGLPTPEEMAAYNSECRTQTGYTGPDVTPTEEECEDLTTFRGICGPDVTEPLEAIVDQTRSKFAGWEAEYRESACDSIVSYTRGMDAWDIIELHRNDWILRYRPSCATSGAEPRCGSSVQVGTDCHYAGSANYVIFGVMCKLCEDHFRALGSPRTDDFSREEMLGWINLYKGLGLPVTVLPFGRATNLEASQAWATAGYDGWPAAPSPPGDRDNCLPVCATPHSDRFIVWWQPFTVF